MKTIYTIIFISGIGIHFSSFAVYKYFARLTTILKHHAYAGTITLGTFSTAGLSYSQTTAHHDSEFETMQSAHRSAQERINGFEGCVSKKTCGYRGFYLERYSPEGLCDSCEFQKFPGRFVSCLFCRVPYKKHSSDTLSVCHGGCSSFIKELLVESTKINNDGRHTEALRIGAHRLLEKLDLTAKRKYIHAFGAAQGKANFSNAMWLQRKTLSSSPGIYLGACLLDNGNKLHAWADKVAVDPSDKRSIKDLDDAERHLEYICKKYNVFGPETGEITLKEVPEGVITYEEGKNK